MRVSISLVVGCLLATTSQDIGAQVLSAPAAISAIDLMQQPGPEMRGLERRAGNWEVSIRIWPDPQAEAMITRNLRAKRQMIGAFLQEIIAPEKPRAGEDFRRISYLHFNRVEGRWQYVSLDTRFPAGIMPAWGTDRPVGDRLTLQFEPIAFPGWHNDVEGWMLRSDYEVTGIGTDHEVARQYWVRADGTGRRWLAVEFDYRRAAQRTVSPP